MNLVTFKVKYWMHETSHENKLNLVSLGFSRAYLGS